MSPHFSTTSGVYPAYLPHLHKVSRVEKKLVPAAVATVGIVYGIAKYKQYRSEQQQRSQYSTRRSAAEQHSNALMNAYGDRSSLAELEQAIKEYEAQQGRR